MPNIVEMYENLLGGKAIFKNDDGNLEDSEGNEINIQNIDLYAPTPTIGDKSSDEVYERDYIELEITNFDKDYIYEADNDIVTRIIHKSENVVKIYFGSVDEDTDFKIKLRALKVGYLASDWSDEISIKVKDSPEVSDDAIINDAFEDNLDDSDGADVINDRVLITTDNGWYKENITEQGDDESNWSSYQTTAYIPLRNAKIASGFLYDRFDLFDDDSSYEMWTLNETLESYTGDRDFTLNGDEVYESSKFRKGFYLPDDDDKAIYTTLDLNDLGETFTISYWIELLSDDTNGYIFAIDDGENEDDCAVRIDISNSGDDAYFGYGTGSTSDLKRTKFDANKLRDKPHHVVMIFDKDNGKAQLYIDKELIIDNDDYEGLNLDANNFSPNNREHGHDSVENIVSQIRIFKKVVNDDEIELLYREHGNLSTKNELAVLEDIQEESKCYIVNNENQDGVLIDLGDVDKEDGEGTYVNMLDILGDESCIATYNLDGDATDLSGNYDGHWKDSDGNEIDGQYDDGKWDKSAKFDGNSYISLNYEFNDSKDLSISLWFNPSNLDDGNAMIHLSKDGDNTFVIASHWSDKTKFAVALNDNAYAIDFDLETDTWYHAVYTTDGKVYVNGDLINTFDETVDATTFNKNAIIGADRDTDDSINDFYEGYIDQVRIFNKVLSDDEVKVLYKEQATYYKADISSNELQSKPTSAYFEEPNFTISTALTKDLDPTDDDFVDEEPESFKINTDTDIKEVTFKKVSDYSGNKFQRKFSGDEGAILTYLRSDMWKKDD